MAEQALEPQKTQERDLARFAPASDVVEREDGFHILVDLPGVDKDELEIDLRENRLFVKAVAHTPQAEGFTFREFGDGEYHRVFTLSQDIDQTRIGASLNNGVLDLHLPRVEVAQPRKIAIAPQ